MSARVVALTLAVVACGAGVAAGTTRATDRASATTVHESTTTAPLTPMLDSLDDFVAGWNEQVARSDQLDPATATLLLDATTFATSPPVQGGMAFPEGIVFAAPLGGREFVGGLLDPKSDEVLAVIAGGHPDSPLVEPVGALLLIAVAPSAEDAEQAATAWADFAADGAAPSVPANAMVGDLVATFESGTHARRDAEVISVTVSVPRRSGVLMARVLADLVGEMAAGALSGDASTASTIVSTT